MTPKFRHTLLVALLALLAAACSTTSRIPPDELLYTGMKLNIEKDSTAMPRELASALSTAAFVRPNNYISFLGVRSPIPYGLWAYNHLDENGGGFRHWLYEKLAEEPVLVGDVRPEVRTRMMEQILDNNGYLRGTATYELQHGRKNRRKAKVIYTVNHGPEFPIDTMILLPDSTRLTHLIDSLARRDTYLSARNPRYCTDSLSAARTRITNSLRNRGYYFFRPDFIEYLADSMQQRGKLAMKMIIGSNIPDFALQPYRTGKVTFYLNRHQGGGVPDTISLDRATLIQMRPSRFKSSLVNENVVFRPGRTFSVRNMDRTQTYLTRLGIFSSVNIDVTPDTTSGRRSRILDVAVTATLDQPLETSLEVNASSKSNSYIGPGLSFGVTNKNVFGGGEQLSVKLTGSYEWQTGHDRRSIFNSYEAGISASLAFPKLLVPKFIPRSRYNLNWTRFNVNADLLNRPHYFKMAQFNASVNYDWRLRRYVQNTLTLFKLTYTNMLHTTEDFDSVMTANPAVAQSFRNTFIPQMSYTYVYDRQFDADNTFNWQFTAQEAGNVFWAIYRACGKDGEKKLFGTPFSQFVKGQTQIVWGRRVGRTDSWLYMRAACGAAHAYGNSSQVPYSEQFYVGGANSVRAFTVRSLGPGSYKPRAGTPEDYFDRTGTFKFEANIEYRFPIYGMLHGALFVDAGNVWLLKKDPMRPGGELKAGKFFEELALGTGVGLRFDISMLVIRGDLGIGIHAPYDTGKRGYYNMTSFGNSLAFHLAIGYPF